MGVLEAQAVRSVSKQLRVVLPIEQGRSCAGQKRGKLDHDELAVAKPGNIHNVTAMDPVDRTVNSLPPL